jgi:hypothetical protein
MATTPPALTVIDTIGVMAGPLPQDAPKWLVNANKMLHSALWEGSWLALLVSWLKYELKNNLLDDGKLGITGCPACIAVWIACSIPNMAACNQGCGTIQGVLALVGESSARVEGGFAMGRWGFGYVFQARHQQSGQCARSPFLLGNGSWASS